MDYVVSLATNYLDACLTFWMHCYMDYCGLLCTQGSAGWCWHEPCLVQHAIYCGVWRLGLLR